MDNRLLLKLWLVQNKMSQKEASERIKIHKVRFNSYLNGLLNLKEEEIKRICKGLKIDYKNYLNNKIVEVKK